MLKADGTVLIHADGGTKALNWMPPGSRVTVEPFQESDTYDGGS
jgi:RecB family endonuclease NucS